MNKTRRMLEIEVAIGEPLENYLQREYFEEGLSGSGIAENLGVGTSSVHRYMEYLGIERRTLSESRKGYKCSEEHVERIRESNRRRVYSEETIKKMAESQKGKTPSEETRRRLSESRRGEKHWNWNGGTSLFRYSPEFSIAMAPYIRERDDNSCQICEKTKEEEGRELSVHHIDYNKKNNEEENLITLCVSCHGSTSNPHRDRETWTELFQEKIGDIYGSMSSGRCAKLLEYKEKLEGRLDRSVA